MGYFVSQQGPKNFRYAPKVILFLAESPIFFSYNGAPIFFRQIGQFILHRWDQMSNDIAADVFGERKWNGNSAEQTPAWLSVFHRAAWFRPNVRGPTAVRVFTRLRSVRTLHRLPLWHRCHHPHRKCDRREQGDWVGLIGTGRMFVLHMFPKSSYPRKPHYQQLTGSPELKLTKTDLNKRLAILSFNPIVKIWLSCLLAPSIIAATIEVSIFKV